MKTIRNLSNLLAALSVLAVSPGAFAATDTWSATASGNWSVGTNWSGGVAPVATNTLAFNSTSGGPIAANNDTMANTAYAGLTFGAGATSFSLTGNAINLSGAVTDSSANAQSITLAQALTASETYSVISGGTLTDNGVISGTGFGITATGGGTLSLGAADTYTGATAVNGGSTLNLNFAAAGAPTTNIINSGDAVTLGGATASGAGGTLKITGAAGAANVETLGSFSLASGANAITLTPGAGGTDALTITTFNAPGANLHGVLQFSSTGTTTLSNQLSLADFANVSGNLYATFGTDDWAATNASGVVGAAAYATASTAITAGAINNITGSFSASGISVNGLRFADPTGRTLTLSATSTIDGILVASTAGTSGLAGTSGFVRPNRASTSTVTDENIIQNSLNPFTIAPNLSNASSSTPVAVIKSGVGTLILTNTSAEGYTGGLYIEGGTVQVGAGGATAGLGSGGVFNYGTLTYDLSGSLTESNIIAGTGALTQIGAGTTTLSSANTFTGTTTISSGAFNLNNALAVQNSTVAVSASNGIQFTSGIGAFTIGGLAGASNEALTDTASSGVALTLGNNSTNATYSGILSGAGSVTKIGTGTQTLSGANTYTGGTSVNNGTLALGGTGTFGNGGALTLGGGTADLGGLSTTVGAVSITAAAASGNTIQAGSLTGTSYAASNTTGNALVTANLLANGSAGFTKSGSGTVSLSGANTYTGGNAINGGLVDQTSSGGLGNGGALTMGGGALDLGGFSDTVGAVSITAAAASGNTIQTGSLTGTSYAASNGSGNAIVTSTLLANGSAGLTKSGSGTLTLTAANTYTGNTTISGGVIQIGNGGVLGATSSTIVFQGGTLTSVYDINTNDSIGQAISVAAGQAGTINMSQRTILNGAVSGAGTLNINANTTLPRDFFSASFDGFSGQLNIAGSGQIGLQIQGGNFDVASFANTSLDLGGSAFLQGTTFSSGVTLNIGALSGSSTTAGFSGATAGRTTLSIGALNTSTSFAGTILGNNAVTKVGTGTLTLSGANTYSGLTSINAGTLAISAANNLGDNTQTTNTIAFGGGTLESTANSYDLGSNRAVALNAGGGTVQVDTGSLTLSGAITGTTTTSSLTKTGTGTLALTGTGNTYTGGTTIKAGTLQISGANNIGTTAPAVTFNGGTLQYTASASGAGSTDITTAPVTTAQNVTIAAGGGTIDTNGNTVTYNNGIGNNGTGGLTLADSNASPGSLILDGVNTYTGATTISSGTLLLEDTTSSPGNNDLSASIGVSLTSSTAAFDIGQGNSQVIKDLSGVTGSKVYLGNDNLTAGTSNSTTFAGSIKNGGNFAGGTNASFTKQGSGTMTLSGANTYTGATKVLGGTLSVTGSLAGGSAAITTIGGSGSSSSPTLNGTGTINGKVIVASAGSGVAGTIAPGTSSNLYGTLTIGGTISFQTGSNFALNLSGASSGELIIGGAATIGSGADITINIGSALTQSSYVLATAASGLNSSSPFTVLGSIPTGYQLVYTGTALDLNLISSTNGQYTLTTTAAAGVIHVGGTTTVSTTIANTGTGTQDTLNYSGLTATSTSGGSVTGTTGSGTALAQGTTSSPATTQTLTGTTAGTLTISNTGTVTNSTATGTPTATNTGTTVAVYSGQGVYTGAGSTGAWGGVSATPTNWTALGGTPGLDASFTGVDTATFGAVSGGTSATTVTLGSSAPNLNAINFTSPDRNYTIAQGAGTNSITLSGTTPGINVTNPGASATAGTQTISAPVIFGATTSLNVASNQTLVMSGAISGVGGLSNTGGGATILSSTTGNSYAGGTTISAGKVYATNASGSATGSSAVSVTGGQLNLASTGSVSGAITLSTGGSLYSGGLVGTPATGTGTGAVLSAALNVNGGNLTFALNAGGTATHASPNLTTSYLTTTSSVSFSGSDSISLVDLSNGGLTLRQESPYLLISANSSSAFFGLVIKEANGTIDLSQNGAQGNVLGVWTGTGVAYTAFTFNQFGSDGVTPLAATNAGNTSGAYIAPYLYLAGGDLEVVPEPGTWALMLGGLALLVVIQRRRSKQA